MPTIYINDQPYEVEEGQNLLHAALSLGLDLPYFCWHPALGSVGACRQCAVKQFKDEDDSEGKLVMACMTPAAQGARISIDDAEAHAFRASVIEWLMVNHPHDCPVCDEGGECHLQDMTVMTGHTYRTYRFDKRTHRNQYLGPFLNHEMNRCIACYRCVRFYRDYAGGDDLDVFGAHDHVYFGRQEEGVLESEFSGNLVEICPTGVFTDKTLKQHYTRKWDLQTAPSVCVGCSLGCNTLPGERYGTLRRIRNRYHDEINGYFLCDRGRYGYEFVNSKARLRQPLAREGNAQVLEPVDRTAAVMGVAEALTGAGRVIGIGSPRASLEANYALRHLVGPDHFYLGLSAQEQRLIGLARQLLQQCSTHLPSLQEVAHADAVLLLGEDVTQTAPLVNLALRQAVRRQPMRRLQDTQIQPWHDQAVREFLQDETGPLFVAATHATKLDGIAQHIYRAAPEDLARLGFAVAHALDDKAPAVPELSEELAALASQIAEALRQAQRPLVISGTGAGHDAVLQAAANVAQALHRKNEQAGLFLIVPEANSMGLALLEGGTLAEAFAALEGGEADTVIILENDLFRRARPQAAYGALDAAQTVIVLDHLAHATSERADIVLPAATFAGSDGTLVNNEGRAQRFYQVFVPAGEVQESWRWLRDVMVAAGRLSDGAWPNLDAVNAALANDLAHLRAVVEVAHAAGFRLAEQKIPRQPFRYSGRTAIHAQVDVHEPRPPQDPDSPLAFSMEGYGGQPPADLITHFWAPGWNSVQALNKFQEEIGGPLRGGEGGRRLIEPEPAGTATYFSEIPTAFAEEEDRWRVIPIHHIFGSEVLSMQTSGIAELAPDPYLAMNADDLEALPGQERGVVTVAGPDFMVELPLKALSGLPRGVVGLPAGLISEAGPISDLSYVSINR